MKKIILIVYMAVILLLPISLAETGSQMTIVNCDAWVSMRKNPDTHSDRMKKVPLGAIVDVLEVDGSFAFCAYDGVKGYILLDYLESADSRTFDDYWGNFSLENIRKYMQKVNDNAGTDYLYNICQEEGDIDSTFNIVANISGVANGKILIWEGGYFLIEADIEERSNPILRELYAITAEYFITHDKKIAEEMYDSLYNDFEAEYQRNYGTTGAYVDSYDRIGRYMRVTEGSNGLRFVAFMGELQ